jgi:hypothetical protein
MYEPPTGTVQENCEYWVNSVWIKDARAMASPPSVHVEGFELWDAPTAVSEAGRPALTFGRHGDGRRPGAAGRIHNDYTESSGQKRFDTLPLDEKVRATAQGSMVRSLP